MWIRHLVVLIVGLVGLWIYWDTVAYAHERTTADLLPGSTRQVLTDRMIRMATEDPVDALGFSAQYLVGITRRVLCDVAAIVYDDATQVMALLQANKALETWMDTAGHVFFLLLTRDYGALRVWMGTGEDEGQARFVAFVFCLVAIVVVPTWMSLRYIASWITHKATLVRP